MAVMDGKLKLRRDPAEGAQAQSMTRAAARRTMLELAERQENLIRELEIETAQRRDT